MTARLNRFMNGIVGIAKTEYLPATHAFRDNFHSPRTGASPKGRSRYSAAVFGLVPLAATVFGVFSNP